MQRRSKYEKANMKVRIAQAENFVAQWEIAEEVGVSEQTVYRWMRKELPEDEQQLLINAIEKIAQRRMQHAD